MPRVLAEFSASAPMAGPPPPEMTPPPPPPQTPPPSPPPAVPEAPPSSNSSPLNGSANATAAAAPQMSQSSAEATPNPSPPPPPPHQATVPSPPPPPTPQQSPPPATASPPPPSPPPPPHNTEAPTSPPPPPPSPPPSVSASPSPHPPPPTTPWSPPPSPPPPPPLELPLAAVIPMPTSPPPNEASLPSPVPSGPWTPPPPPPPEAATPIVPLTPPVMTSLQAPATPIASGAVVVTSNPAVSPLVGATQVIPPPPSPGTPENLASSAIIGASPAPPAESSGTASSGVNVQAGVLIGVAVAGFLLALVAVFLLSLRRKNKKRRYVVRRGPSGRQRSMRDNATVVPTGFPAPPDVYQPSNAPSASPSAMSSYGAYAGAGPDFSGSKSWFTYEELVDATGGFSPENVIGEGGFGRVYRGALPDGRLVAVKQLKVGGGQGEREFRAEVEIISRIHHRHLVTLAGCCVTEHHRLLVYEFVPNKTLGHHLHGKGLPLMDWPKRMKIAIGSARGLAYLHEDCHPRIIHRDIKSANILLDDAFEAKVADFGLAKLTNDSLTHVSTRVVGTFGYMAPEYASSGKLTDRSDVFSFGVVLLELITGRKPVDASQPLGEESLVEWARPLLVSALEKDDFQQVADSSLQGNFSKAEMRKMVEAAAACVRHSASKRPRMVQVLRALDSEGSSPDLTNGVKFGQSTAYDSSQYSADIENFRKMAFATDANTADFISSESDACGAANPSTPK